METKYTKKQDKTVRKMVKKFRKQEIDELYIVSNYLFEFSRVFFNKINPDEKLFENLEEEIKKFDNVNVLKWFALENFVKMYLLYNQIFDDLEKSVWDDMWVQTEDK